MVLNFYSYENVGLGNGRDCRLNRSVALCSFILATNVMWHGSVSGPSDDDENGIAKKRECVYKSWCGRHSENDCRRLLMIWCEWSKNKTKTNRIETAYTIANVVLVPDSADSSATLRAALFANNDYFANQKWDLVGIYRYSQKVVILAQSLWSSSTKATALFRAWRQMIAVLCLRCARSKQSEHSMLKMPSCPLCVVELTVTRLKLSCVSMCVCVCADLTAECVW